MKKITLEIDLNKLSIPQLKSYVELVDYMLQQSIGSVDYIVPEKEILPTKTEETPKRKYKKRRKYNKHKKVRKMSPELKIKYEQVIDYVKNHNISITKACKKVFGYTGSYVKRAEKLLEQSENSVSNSKKYMIKNKAYIPNNTSLEKFNIGNNHISIKKEFPTIQNVKLNELLINTIAKLVNNPMELSLRMGIEGFLLGIENIEDWELFCADFLTKSNKISEYFNIPNKFKLTKNNVIVYR